MTGLAIDTRAARRAAGALLREGDRHQRHATSLRADLEALHLTWSGLAARRRIELAGDTAWRAATFLHLVSDAAEDGDRLDRAALDGLAAVAAGAAGPLSAGNLADHLLGTSPDGGDLGGTSGTELRMPYTIFGADAAERGRSLLMRAVADAGDAHQIRPDEFEIVQLTPERFVLVLPGVTDLSNPDLGLSDAHRSVRDLDRAAWSSAWSSSVEDNPYAQAVHRSVEAAGVPLGSELMIVGHSFGADTAVDLAADPGFNGRDYRVTHVVAAGYHVDEFLDDVPADTAVLVLQNHRDVPVIAEAVGHSAAAEAVTAGADAVSDWVTGDLGGAATGAWRSFRAHAAAWWEVGGFLVDRRDDVADLAVGIGTANWVHASAAVHRLATLEPGVSTPAPNAVVDVFEGGAAGAGHDTANYVHHLAATTDPSVVAFLADVDRAGYATSGSAVAVDISVP